MSGVFSPFSLGPLALKNRIARSATQDNLGGSQGQITPAEALLYQELAKNQVALLFSAHAYVTPEGKASPTQNGLEDERNLPILEQIAGQVHEQGAKMVMQLSHAGEKSVSSRPLGPDGMSLQDLRQVRDAFVQAAMRAQRAGMDGVQIHCAHGYLLSQFLSPLQNHRQDAYGGCPENRFRLALEIIQGIQDACGGLPILIKINSNLPDAQADLAFEGDLETVLHLCRQAGVAAAEVSGCDFRSFPRQAPPYYLARAARLRKACGLPLLLVGGIRSDAHIRQVLEAGLDMVSLFRPLICQPDLVLRLQQGPYTSPCLSCNQCFAAIGTEGRTCVLHTKGADRQRLGL